MSPRLRGVERPTQAAVRGPPLSTRGTQPVWHPSRWHPSAAKRQERRGRGEASYGVCVGDATDDLVPVEAVGSISWGFRLIAFFTSASPAATFPVDRSRMPRFM